MTGLVTGYKTQLKSNSEFEFVSDNLPKADKVVQQDDGDVYVLEERITEKPEFYGEYRASLEEVNLSEEDTTINSLDGYFDA